MTDGYRGAMSRTLRAFLIAVALAALPVSAEVIEIAATGTSDASTDTGEIPSEGDIVSVQLCGGTGGDVFSGSISVKQGNETGKLVEVWNSGTITSQSDCAVATYAQIPGPAALTQVVITRTSGKYGAWYHRWPR